MNNASTPARPGLLTVIVCAAGPAADVGKLVALAHHRGWQIQVVSTPAARSFVDVDAIHALTGRPVRSCHRQAGQPRSSARTDAIIVAPATYNTINKMAAGIADNYALTLLAEAPGLGIPVVVLPFVNAALAANPAYRRSIAALDEAAISVIGEAQGILPHPPGAGAQWMERFPWHAALDALPH